MSTARPLYLAAPSRLAAAPADGPRRLSGTAYSGGVVDYYGSRLVLDLAGIHLPSPCPVLESHDRALRVGVATLAVRDGALVVDGRLLSNPRAAAIAADADDGFPWQMSVHAEPGAVTQLAAGGERQINGRAVAGPLEIWQAVRIREVSLTPTGVDDATTARVLADDPAATPPLPSDDPEQESAMPDTAPPDTGPMDARAAELTARVEALSAERDAALARANAAEGALAEQGRAARLVEVRATFAELSRPIDDAGAEAYLALTDAQWLAVRGHLIAAGSDDGAAALLAEQATDGRRPDGPRAGATFEAPAEYRVDPQRAELHRRAAAYAAEHHVDLAAAVRAVEQGV